MDNFKKDTYQVKILTEFLKIWKITYETNINKKKGGISYKSRQTALLRRTKKMTRGSIQ